MSHTFISTTFLSSSRQIVRHPTGCQIRPLCPPTSAIGVGEAVHVNRSIFSFENAERICHTGIVYKVDSTTVYTIEGNTSAGEQVVPNGGAVCKKSYKLYNSRIAGFGRLDYSSVSDSDPDPEPVKRVWAKAQLPMIR